MSSSVSSTTIDDMSKNFDKHSEDWKEYQGKPWGLLFYTISHQYLKPYIPPSPGRILDIGGGNGISAIRLAKEGHQVSILDISKDLLGDALKSADDAGVGTLIDIYHNDVLELGEIFQDPEFDLILCHNVMAYTNNINQAISQIFNVLKPGGYLSLISVNRYSEVLREAIHQTDPKAAIERIDNNQYTSATFKASRLLYSPEEMLSFFKGIDLNIEDQFGIRCVNDYISDNELKEDPAFFDDLLQLELILGNRYPYNLLGRFFHIILRKV